MHNDWPTVVESVRSVAPSLLADPETILKVIVYAETAVVVGIYMYNALRM